MDLLFYHLIVQERISSIHDVQLNLQHYSLFRIIFVEYLGMYHLTKPRRRNAKFQSIEIHTSSVFVLAFRV